MLARGFLVLFGLLLTSWLTPAFACGVLPGTCQYNNVVVTNIGSGGQQGINPGCLYVQTTAGMFVLPNDPKVNPLATGQTQRTITHPPFGTLSFNVGPASPTYCPGAPTAPTFLFTSSP